MSVTKERIHAVINSKNRLDPTISSSDSFSYSFNRNINRITGIVIDSVQIPYSFYIFNSQNNKLVVEYNGKNTITITPGNYTSASLAAEIKLQLDKLGINTTVLISYNNYKLTITSDVAIQIYSSMGTNADLASTASIYLGFRTTSISDINITSDSSIKINGPNYINLISTFLTKPIHNKTLYADNSYQNVLMAIPVNTGPGGIISTEPHLPIKYSYKYDIKSTDKIDFQIKDEMGNTLDFNGLDISIQMIFITE